jgi:phage RecT family recombinase
MTEETQALVEWQAAPVATVPEAVERVMLNLESIAPRNLNIDKFRAQLSIEFSSCPNIEKCDPLQVMKIVADIASLGLEPGNEVYLRVFYSSKDKRHVLNKMVGFHAWYRILVESPRIKKVVTDVVCKGDEFFQDRLNDEYRHIIPQNAPRSEITHAYCVVTLDNGERLYRILDRKDIERHQRAAQNSGETGPWKDHYSVMAMKSAMQDFAARHRGLINAIAREALAQDESAMLQEYQMTPPSQDRYETAVNELFGDAPDRPHPSRKRSTSSAARARQVSEYTVDHQTGEIVRNGPPDDGPSLDESQHVLQERAKLGDYLRQHQFQLKDVKSLVAQTAEVLGMKPDTPFDEISRIAWLEAIRAKAEGIVGLREPEAGEEAPTQTEPELI